MILRIPLLPFIIFILPYPLSAQTDSLQYFDHYWEETTRDSAAYYRAVDTAGRFFKARDYYISGMMQMTGTYISLEPEIQHGYFIWYYENGQKYAEGNYVSGKRESIWTFWFPDGLKKEEMKFNPGRQSDIAVKWQSKRLKSSRQLIEKAQNELDKRKVDKALEMLDAALQVNPYSAEAYYEKGMIEYDKGEQETGCAYFLKAREFWFYDMMAISEVIESKCTNDQLKKKIIIREIND